MSSAQGLLRRSSDFLGAMLKIGCQLGVLELPGEALPSACRGVAEELVERTDQVSGACAEFVVADCSVVSGSVPGASVSVQATIGPPNSGLERSDGSMPVERLWGLLTPLGLWRRTDPVALDYTRSFCATALHQRLLTYENILGAVDLVVVADHMSNAESAQVLGIVLTREDISLTVRLRRLQQALPPDELLARLPAETIWEQLVQGLIRGAVGIGSPRSARAYLIGPEGGTAAGSFDICEETGVVGESGVGPTSAVPNYAPEASTPRTGWAAE